MELLKLIKISQIVEEMATHVLEFLKLIKISQIAKDMATHVSSTHGNSRTKFSATSFVNSKFDGEKL